MHAAALHALGLEFDDLRDVVGGMLTRRRRDAVNYWLQLLLSMGIATLGLALGSTAVVIGAMLIAPLMGPIIELGMALVLGSPAVTVRSLGRTAGSIAAVIAGAALLTLLLPFQEINPEIASRTFPTALDLAIAVFVALAAVFTTVRSSSETTSAAAGTAIGIALVPPLCVIGFGLGIGNLDVAGGATLLFVTNLTAILFISVTSFWVLGFETVDVSEWEEAALASARPGSMMLRAMRAIRAVYGSRYGKTLRVAVPATLVAAVIAPLSTALDQVAWEVRARTAVARILDEAVASRNAVRSDVSIKQGSVGLQLYLVGDPNDASALQQQLAIKIAKETSVEPTVRVVAVPDLSVLRQSVSPRPSTEPRLPATVRLPEIDEQIAAALKQAWPAEQLGPLLGWHLEFPDSAAPRLVVRHRGAAAGPAVDELLGRALSQRITAPVQVRSQAVSLEPLAEERARGAEWLPGFIRSLDTARQNPGLRACVSIPGERSLRGNAALQRIAGVVRGEVARLAPERASLTETTGGWEVRLSTAPCAPEPAAQAAP